MLNRFTQFIEEHSLCTRENIVLLAVSGGMDSMVMLDLFSRAGLRIAVAHVNFNLRGVESDRDSDFIASYCRSKGISFHTTCVNTNNYAITHKLSTQMAARQLRYDWFRQLLRDGHGHVIATAHHLDDSAETILLNLARGSGNEGLMGIPISGNSVIRPLMFATRTELHNYAAEQNVLWREDESNQSGDYQRNVVRHQVIPIMRSINPSLEHSLQRTMLKAAGDEELIESALKLWKEGYVHNEGGQTRIGKTGLALFRHQQSLLLRLIEPFGFNFSNCVDVLDVLDGQPGKVFYSATHQLVIDRTHIIITKTPARLEPVSIASGERSSALGPFELAIHEQQDSKPVRDAAVAFLDKDKVSFPLQWRSWKEGDYFFPLGMTGKKKVSDFLVDLKLSLPDKQSVTVIESGKEIICLPGFRIDDRFKVTPQTRTALVLELKRS